MMTRRRRRRRARREDSDDDEDRWQLPTYVYSTLTLPRSEAGRAGRSGATVAKPRGDAGDDAHYQVVSIADIMYSPALLPKDPRDLDPSSNRKCAAYYLIDADLHVEARAADRRPR